MFRLKNKLNCSYVLSNENIYLENSCWADSWNKYLEISVWPYVYI